MVGADTKKADCVRSVANWSRVEKSHIFDQAAFDANAVQHAMHKASPKLVALFQKIDELDAIDMEKHGKHYKHMVFTDVKQSQYGVKILAAAFLAKGYNHYYTSKFEIESEKNLKLGKNFATLCSSTIYGKKMSVKCRKNIFAAFNARPENVHGEHLRFLLLDRGFKEGIDLFDVKYVHLFEPLISASDEKQAIGRATRFCGQKGLPFHPQRGWDLHVYHYEVSIPEHTYDATRMLQLYLKYSGFDLRRLVFASTLEKTTMLGAVDFSLTRNIHDPTRDHGSNELQSLFDAKPTAIRPRPPSTEKPVDMFDRAKLIRFDRMKGPLFTPKVAKLKRSGGGGRPMAPRTKLNSPKMQKYIQDRFGRYTWPKMKMENMCTSVVGGEPHIVQFTPTQDFIRNYFNPSSVYKGLLLYHGVGVGKTCTAMATASTSFERQGYTILWVTRHTLKADIWKNMFQQVCSLTIRERIKKGERIPPDAVLHPRKHLSKAWMEPISYKQFSNLLEGKNDLYSAMVARNSAKDPLRKTLIILDEAHKLYAPDLLPSERPNVATLRERIHNSYEVSGKDSCKVLLMSATPFNTDPMEMIQLLNLLRPKDEAMPEEFEAFNERYLDPNGSGLFTEIGKEMYLDDIAGYVSYLNRDKDARQFAIPQFHNVIVPMSRSEVPGLQKQATDLDEHLAKIDKELLETKYAIATIKQRVRDDTAVRMEDCKEAPRGKKQECRQKVRESMRAFEDEYLRDLNQQMNNHRIARKDIVDNQKKVKNKIKDFKQDLSQEGALEGRCGLKIAT